MSANFDKGRNIDQGSYPTIFCNTFGAWVKFDECRNCQWFRKDDCPKNKRMDAFERRSEEHRRQVTKNAI